MRVDSIFESCVRDRADADARTYLLQASYFDALGHWGFKRLPYQGRSVVSADDLSQEARIAGDKAVDAYRWICPACGTRIADYGPWRYHAAAERLAPAPLVAPGTYLRYRCGLAIQRIARPWIRRARFSFVELTEREVMIPPAQEAVAILLEAWGARDLWWL